MAQAKHTPGPWALGQNPAAIESGSFSNMLVVRPEGEFPHGLWVADCGNHYDPEHLANARLIAAAPDMLEALGQAQGLLNPLSGFVKQGNAIQRRHLDKVRDEIRAAIAKATGEDSHGE